VRFAARRRWIVAITAIGALVAGSLAFWLVGGGDSGPETTIIHNGEVWLHGEVRRLGEHLGRPGEVKQVQLRDQQENHPGHDLVSSPPRRRPP
jgi:hypothetical protein